MEKEKTIAWLDKIIEFSLCTLIFTLPFSKSMVEIFFTLAFVCWVVKRWITYSPQSVPLRQGSGAQAVRSPLALIKAFKPVSTKLNLPIYVFAFLGFLSTVTSVSLLLSLEGFFFKLFEWVMIYFIVVEVINNRKKINRILGVLLFSMAVIGLNGIFQYMRGVDFIRGYLPQGSFITSSFHNPNSFAGWLVIMIPLALCLPYFGKDNWLKFSGKYNWVKRAMKSILWILAGILIFCLASTHARGAWIACFLSLIFIGVFKNRKLLIVTIAILLILPFIAPDSIKKSASSLLSSADRNVIVRQELWQEALSIIKDFPLLGSGLNTYAAVAPRYKITKTTGFYPHNSYFHMAAESGLLGLGAFLWILIALFWASLTNLRRIDDRFYNAVLIGLLAGLFGFLAHSFVDVNIYTLKLGNLMWFMIGLIIAVQRVCLIDLENQ